MKSSKIGSSVLISVIIITCVISLGIAQNDAFWTWGGPSIDLSGGISGSNGKIYSISYEDTGDSSKTNLFSWYEYGTAIGNISYDFKHGNQLNDVAVDDEYIYTCGESYNVSTFSYGVSYPYLFDGWITKWNKNLTQIWNHTWAHPDRVSLTKIWVGDEYIYTAGQDAVYAEPYLIRRWCLVKWDKDGNKIWNFTYNYPTYNGYIDNMWSNGNDVYLIGKSEVTINGIFSLRNYLLKIDSEGNMDWIDYLGGSTAYDFINIFGDQTGIYICGKETYSENSYNNVLRKISHGGDDLWKETWSNRKYELYGYSNIWGDENNIYCGCNASRIRIPKNMELVICRWNKEGKMEAETSFNIVNHEFMQDMGGSENNLFISGYFEPDTNSDYLQTENFIYRIPKDFISDKIPGFSIFVILGCVAISVSIVFLKYRKKNA